jgi:hypothetical protein
MFNADAFLAAQAPWQLTTRGKTYTARAVSAPQVARYLAAATGTPAAFKNALESLLREAFPWRPSFRWRGDPVQVILAMPPSQLAATLTDFFASQGLTAQTLSLTMRLSA